MSLVPVKEPEPRLSLMNVRTQEDKCCNTRWWIREGTEEEEEEEEEDNIESELGLEKEDAGLFYDKIN